MIIEIYSWVCSGAGFLARGGIIWKNGTSSAAANNSHNQDNGAWMESILSNILSKLEKKTGVVELKETIRNMMSGKIDFRQPCCVGPMWSRAGVSGNSHFP